MLKHLLVNGTQKLGEIKQDALMLEEGLHTDGPH